MSDDNWMPADIIEVLDDHDGNPRALTEHSEIPYVLAKWKHSDDWRDRNSFQMVDDEINWHGVNMKKQFFEDIIDQVHEEAQEEVATDGGDAEASIPDMTPDEFRGEFDWEHMMDREIAHKCHLWTKENADIIYSNKQVMVRNDDIWEPNERMVARTLRDLVGQHYGDNVKQEFLKGYVSVDDEYRVNWSEVGLDGPRCVVENGVLNLVTGELDGEVEADDYAVMKFPVEWEGMDAARKRFEEGFLKLSVASEDVKKLQEYAGYCLHTNEYPYKTALMMVGDGNNGKGVFEQILCALLGEENTMHDGLKELSDNQFGAQRLRHNAANINSDIEGNEIKNASTFKKLTGRDSIRVEPKFEEAFSITNPAKLLFAANKVPKVDDATLAFYAQIGRAHV